MDGDRLRVIVGVHHLDDMIDRTSGLYPRLSEVAGETIEVSPRKTYWCADLVHGPFI